MRRTRGRHVDQHLSLSLPLFFFCFFFFQFEGATRLLSVGKRILDPLEIMDLALVSAVACIINYLRAWTENSFLNIDLIGPFSKCHLICLLIFIVIRLIVRIFGLHDIYVDMSVIKP